MSSMSASVTSRKAHCIFKDEKVRLANKSPNWLFQSQFHSAGAAFRAAKIEALSASDSSTLRHLQLEGFFRTRESSLFFRRAMIGATTSAVNEPVQSLVAISCDMGLWSQLRREGFASAATSRPKTKS